MSDHSSIITDAEIIDRQICRITELANTAPDLTREDIDQIIADPTTTSPIRVIGRIAYCDGEGITRVSLHIPLKSSSVTRTNDGSSMSVSGSGISNFEEDYNTYCDFYNNLLHSNRRGLSAITLGRFMNIDGVVSEAQIKLRQEIGAGVVRAISADIDLTRKMPRGGDYIQRIGLDAQTRSLLDRGDQLTDEDGCYRSLDSDESRRIAIEEMPPNQTYPIGVPLGLGQIDQILGYQG